MKKAVVGHDRSGNARYGNGYCCLGVACHIMGVAPKKLVGEPLIIGKVGELAKEVGVPEEIMGGGDYSNNRLVNKLVSLNDVKKASFEQIADWVEKNL